MSHADTLQLLGAVKVGDDTSGQGTYNPCLVKTSADQAITEHIGQCWAIDPVNFQWSGNAIDETKVVTLKHSSTGAYLKCNKDGTLTTSFKQLDFSTEDCQWTIKPKHFAGPMSTISQGTDPFYLMSQQPHSRVLSALDSDGGLQTIDPGLRSERDCFVANAPPVAEARKLAQVRQMIFHFRELAAVMDDFNSQYGKKMTAAADKIRQMHADSNQWSSLRSIDAVAALEPVISAGGAKILKYLRRFMCECTFFA